MDPDHKSILVNSKTPPNVSENETQIDASNRIRENNSYVNPNEIKTYNDFLDCEEIECYSLSSAAVSSDNDDSFDRCHNAANNDKSLSIRPNVNSIENCATSKGNIESIEFQNSSDVTVGNKAFF